MQDIQILWEKVLEKMELLVTVVSFDLWIKTIEVLDLKDDKTLILVATSSFAKNQLVKNHSKQIAECVEQFLQLK